jgi:hypothetical protein
MQHFTVVMAPHAPLVIENPDIILKLKDGKVA